VVSGLRGSGTDFTVSRGGGAVTVEMKAAEEFEERKSGRKCFSFHGHGTHDNGQVASIWSQVAHSGADVLLFTWKPGGAQRGWLLVRVAAITNAQRGWLRGKGSLKRSPEQLHCPIVGFGVPMLRSGQELRAAFASLLPA
jgi:hypothetical protein